ncbi:MAG: hypothetical protein A3G09_04485 [Candidatus Moranbacteria bacterium RIFCSPLOWO2_12_FULL_48_12]|nr:MAG: hypothetical protein A3G09_04485 [Candidatus Moranbacteria bacterium RIFCSPLOWO2_12_FULL_48_12]
MLSSADRVCFLINSGFKVTIKDLPEKYGMLDSEVLLSKEKLTVGVAMEVATEDLTKFFDSDFIASARFWQEEAKKVRT